MLRVVVDAAGGGVGGRSEGGGERSRAGEGRELVVGDVTRLSIWLHRPVGYGEFMVRMHEFAHQL